MKIEDKNSDLKLYTKVVFTPQALGQAKCIHCTRSGQQLTKPSVYTVFILVIVYIQKILHDMCGPRVTQFNKYYKYIILVNNITCCYILGILTLMLDKKALVCL